STWVGRLRTGADLPPYRGGMRRALLLGLLTVALIAAGCGDDDDTETTTDTSAPTETETETDTDTDTDTETETETAEPTSTTATPTPSELPGDRIEIFPYEGNEVIVVAVEADDVLNVRAAPGVEYGIVAELDPLADGIMPTGHNRQLDDGSIWAEIDA